MAKEKIQRAPKQYFKDGEIGHAWVHGWYRRNNGTGEQVFVTEGEVRGGSRSFCGDVYYSYSMPIASRFKTEDGWVYLFDVSTVSSTTTSHQSGIRHAVPDEINGVVVWQYALDLGSNRGYPGGNYRLPLVDQYHSWYYCIGRLLELANTELEKAKRARNNRGRYLSYCNANRAKAQILRDTFSKTKPGNAQLLIDYPDVLFAPSELDPYTGSTKPANPNRRQTVTNSLIAAKHIPHLPLLAARAFHAGIDHITYRADGIEGLHPKTTFRINVRQVPWDFVRLVGNNNVITSQGVSMTRREAINLYKVILQVCRTQERMKAGYWDAYTFTKLNEHPVWGVNRLQNDMLDCVKIGCHTWHPLSIASDYLHIIRAKITDDGLDFELNEDSND